MLRVALLNAGTLVEGRDPDENVVLLGGVAVPHLKVEAGEELAEQGFWDGRQIGREVRQIPREFREEVAAEDT